MHGNRVYIPALMLAMLCYFLTIAPVKTLLVKRRETVPVLYLPPAALLSTFSLDYKNILSEILMFRSINYYGDRLLKKAHPDWEWFYKMLDAAVTLDPYNIDAHYVAQAILPWEVGMAKEANAILEKGMLKRSWDWYLPFFAGFNHSYFLRDNKSAALYFKKAARLNPAIATVAGKYMQKSGDSVAGIAFLKAFLEQTENKNIRKSIGMRLRSLENIIFLQRGVEQYKERFGKAPDSLERLVSEKIVSEIPEDPYKKVYFISEKGVVDLKRVKKVKKRKKG